MVDFEEKMKDIVSDYYSTIGKFNNVSKLISLELYKINEDDSEEVKLEKEGQKRELLVDLGRIAEMAFKYLIKIRRMELFPNEPYQDSFINGSVVRGFKDKATLSNGVVRDIANKVHAKSEDIDKILNVTSIGPKAHDFYYLYLIIDKLMPDIRNQLNQITFLLLKSINSAKVLEEEGYEYKEYIAFPNELLRTYDEEDKDHKAIIELIKKRNQIILNNGDIFTRLRYYSNNPFDKNHNIDDIYDMVYEIIHFIKIVHLCNEKLDFNPEIAFSYSVLMNNGDWSRFSLDEIKQIYNHDKLKDNPSNIMYCILVSFLSVKEIFEIVDSNEIDEEDYNLIFSLSINLETIKYFRSLGIMKYEEMVKQLTYKTSNSDRKLLYLYCDTRYTLDEYKKIAEYFEVKKYPYILNLLDHISIESVLELKKDPDLLNFFINEFYHLVNASSYQYNTKLFKMLLTIDELRENKKAWYGLDVDQLDIYLKVSKILNNDPLNKDSISKRNLNLETIKENIILNIEYFEHNPNLLAMMPLMLDLEDNKAILNILLRNGLNLKKIEYFDPTIFCFPLKLVEVIEKILHFNKIPLIIDNDVNPVVMKIILMISKNQNSDIKIYSRKIMRSASSGGCVKSQMIGTKKHGNESLGSKRTIKAADKILNCDQNKLYNYIMCDKDDDFIGDIKIKK